MLKFNLVKFEAQDVITASGAAAPVGPAAPETVVIPACTNPNGHTAKVTVANGSMKFVCEHCGVEADSTGSFVGGK